jgi:hypothetical protein
LGLLALFVGFLTACSTDVDVNAPWKEQTIVTCLVDPNQAVHYIRIHKAYLDPNRNALVVAAIRDSLYHDPSRTKVWIEIWKNGVLRDSLACTPMDSVLNGGGGIFPDTLRLYRFSSPLVGGLPRLDSSAEHRLRILTPAGQSLSASLFPIGRNNSLPGGLPPGGNLPPNFGGLNWSANQGHQVAFTLPVNTSRYNFSIRAYYDEWCADSVPPGPPPHPDTPGLRLRSIEWPITTNGLNPGLGLITRVFGKNLFSLLNASLAKEPRTHRRLRGTLFHFYWLDEPFGTYLEVTNSSPSMSDVKPTFTNVTNGLGLFAGRRAWPDPIMDAQNPGYPFSSRFYRQALGGIGTDSLRLKYPDLNFQP